MHELLYNFEKFSNRIPRGKIPLKCQTPTVNIHVSFMDTWSYHFYITHNWISNAHILGNDLCQLEACISRCLSFHQRKCKDVPYTNFIQMWFIYVYLPHPKHLTLKMVAAYSSGKLVTTKTVIWTHTAMRTLSYVSWSKIDNASKQANKWHLLSKFLREWTQTYLPDSFWSLETSAFEAAGRKEGDKVLYITWILLDCHLGQLKLCQLHVCDSTGWWTAVMITDILWVSTWYEAQQSTRNTQNVYWGDAYFKSLWGLSTILFFLSLSRQMLV